MKTTKKALLALVCAAALVFGSVFATYAYLTSTTGVVTNTFTVGNVTITLDEAAVDAYGKKIDITGNDSIGNEDRRTENTYKLIPGQTYVKDPTVHVASGSEDAWLFVKVENGIAGIEDATTIENQMLANNTWTKVSNATGVYAYKETVSAGEDIPVFATFTLTGNADVSAYKEAEIKVTAYAVQAAGFNTAEAAWKDAPKSDWITTQGNN